MIMIVATSTSSVTLKHLKFQIKCTTVMYSQLTSSKLTSTIHRWQILHQALPLLLGAYSSWLSFKTAADHSAIKISKYRGHRSIRSHAPVSMRGRGLNFDRHGLEIKELTLLSMGDFLSLPLLATPLSHFPSLPPLNTPLTLFPQHTSYFPSLPLLATPLSLFPSLPPLNTPGGANFFFGRGFNLEIFLNL